MSTSCGKLATQIAFYDCKNPLIPGIKPNAYLINHEDIDISKTEIVDGVITKLVLKEGANALKVETLNDGLDANLALAKGAYYNGWDHNFVFRIFDNTPDVKKFIDEVSKSRLVAIIENNYIKYNEEKPEEGEQSKKGNTVYEAYGFYTGLQLNEATRDVKDNDTKGGYVLTCGCSENAKEPSLPLTVFAAADQSMSALESTQAMLNKLVNQLP